MTGRFIAFEGIDGSGKGVQISLLAAHLASQNILCHQTREPSDGPIGKLLRSYLRGATQTDERALAALFAADRLDHLYAPDHGLAAHLARGTFVITDRYYLSSYAYNSAAAPLAWVMDLNRYAHTEMQPDCYLFIDVPVEVAIARIHKRNEPTELYETRERLMAVRQRYLQLIDELKPLETIHIIDGNRDIQTIHKEICQLVSAL